MKYPSWLSLLRLWKPLIAALSIAVVRQIQYPNLRNTLGPILSERRLC